MNNPLLSTEWVTLQTEFDAYEKYALVIKLVHIVLYSLFSLHSAYILSVFIAMVIWFQDAIWKTFQSRIEQRIYCIEQAIAENSHLTPMQFNSVWLQQRPSSVGLLIEYIKSALKPTVAFPHFVMFIVSLYLTYTTF